MESPDFRGKATTAAAAAAKQLSLEHQCSPTPSNDYGQHFLFQNQNRAPASRKRGDVLMGGVTGNTYPLTERKNQDGLDGQNGSRNDLVCHSRKVKFQEE